MVDSETLNNYIKEKGIKKVYIASKLGITLAALINKVYNRTHFTLEEIQGLRIVLKMSDKDLMNIFFNDNADKLSTNCDQETEGEEK